MRLPVARLLMVVPFLLVLCVSAPFAADPATEVCELSCEDRCRAHAVELYKTCLAAGGDPDACAERARGAFAACVEQNCRPDPTCEERCRAHADELQRACVAAGNDPEACAERARLVLAVCIQEHCTPPPTCEDRCKAQGEEIHRQCVAAGNDPAQCAERARAATETCIRQNCGLCVCPDVIDPVCGADGKTYPNACEARCAGVVIAHPGECEAACRCNADCRDGLVCQSGFCRPRCAPLCFRYDLVCGSNGWTYGCGAAEAACNGVKVLHPGECRPTCESDRSCPAGTICAPASPCPDPCGCASFCQACACPRIFEPVCGADRKTYANACLARCAHVAVAHKGACTAVRQRM